MDDQTNDSVKIESLEVEKKEEEVNTGDHVKEKKRTKEEKSKKKDDKRTAEQILKGLNNVHSVEDKLEIMCKKYSELVDENRKLQLTLKQYDKKMLMLQREKEKFQSERSKAALTRRRLESLCRELQKQKKAIKEENLLKLREQEEMRKELSEKFKGGLAQITVLMNQNIEKNAKMFEENLEMKKKFKSVFEQVELKEQQLLNVHNQVKLDLELSDAKLAKVKVEATAEKEALLKEKQQLLYKLTEYQVQIRELQATEVALRSQVSMYTDKYDEFQNALTRSNKVYGEFNEEMEKMSKKILTLEKETSLWKQRWENTHAALLEMAADKQIRDSEMATLSKKLSLLQDLCRMFQCERTNLLAQLKEKEKENESIKNEESNARDGAKSSKEVDETTKDCTSTGLEEVPISAPKSSDTTPKEKDAVDNILVKEEIELKEQTGKKNEVKQEKEIKGNQIEDCKEENSEQITEKTTEVIKEVAEDKPVSQEENEELNVYLNNTETDALETATTNINQDISENVGLLKQMNLLVEQMSATTNSEIESLDMEIKSEMPDNISDLPDCEQIAEVQLTEQINLSDSDVKDVDGNKEDVLPLNLETQTSDNEIKQTVVEINDEASCGNNSIQQEAMPLEVQEIIVEPDTDLSRLNPKEDDCNNTSVEVELHNNVAQVSNRSVQDTEQCEIIKSMIDNIVNGDTETDLTTFLKTDDKSIDNRAANAVSSEGDASNAGHAEDSEKQPQTSCTLSDKIPAEVEIPFVECQTKNLNGEIKNDAEATAELISTNVTQDDPAKEIPIAADVAQTNIDAECSKAAPMKNAKRKKK